MKRDISSRADIEKFMTTFYERVIPNPVIGFIFTEVAHMNLQSHLPVIVDFWETILLDNPVYKKNAMEVHYDLNKKTPLKKEYFDEWLSLFNTTLDEMYEGRVAELAKKRARSIATLMQYKMDNNNNKISLL